jgi:hypothetical protein
METGKVYVVHNDWIQDPETGEMPYKIGITKGNVDDRYYGLGLKMPGEFICDFAYEFDEKYSQVEKTLHNMLNQVNVNGEWFNVNEEALSGIKSICELAGGKLITEKIEIEIGKATGAVINPDFCKIINLWDSVSEMKTTGNALKKRSIRIPQIKEAVYYAFRMKNSKEVAIDLDCWTKKYPNFNKILSFFDGININGYIFTCLPLSDSQKRKGLRGRIRTIILMTNTDDIVDTMKKFIGLTQEKIIMACNEQ